MDEDRDVKQIADRGELPQAHSFLRTTGGLSLIALSGCDLAESLRSDEATWIWLVVPLLGFLTLGLALVFYSRRAQLRRWNLRAAPSDPGARRLVLRVGMVAVLLAAAFVAYNFYLDLMDPRQRLWNIGFWLLGTVLGVLGALGLGLKQAEPRLLTDTREERN